MAGNSKNKRKSAGTRKNLLSKSPLTIRQSGEDARLLKLRPFTYLEELRDNRGTSVGWTTLRYRIQVGLMLAERHFKDGPMEVITDAIKTVEDVLERFKLNGLWRAREMEIETIKDALVLTDHMQDHSTRREHLHIFIAVDAFMAQHYPVIL